MSQIWKDTRKDAASDFFPQGALKSTQYWHLSLLLKSVALTFNNFGEYRHLFLLKKSTGRDHTLDIHKAQGK